MPICGAINKYDIDSFNLYILETLDFSYSSILDKRKFLSQNKKKQKKKTKKKKKKKNF